MVCRVEVHDGAQVNAPGKGRPPFSDLCSGEQLVCRLLDCSQFISLFIKQTICIVIVYQLFLMDNKISFKLYIKFKEDFKPVL